jgi:hypothetical protein
MPPRTRQGIVTDIQYCAPLSCPVELRAGSYADLDGAQLYDHRGHQRKGRRSHRSQRRAQQAPGFRQRIEQGVSFAIITIIEGTGASQLGIGMVASSSADAILRDQQCVIPIGAYNARYGVTLSLPAVVKRLGLSRVLQPDMTDSERQALDESANQLRQAVASWGRSGERISVSTVARSKTPYQGNDRLLSASSWASSSSGCLPRRRSISRRT